MRWFAPAALALLLALAGGGAAADQTDPRLDDLFAKLKTAPDPGAAARLDAQIWRIWLQHPDARAYEATRSGIGYLSSGRAAEAEKAFTEALELQPDFAEAWNKRATVRFFMGDLEGSVEDCAHVLKLEPRHYGALAGLGMIHMAIEEWDAAAAWFREALAINPHMPGVRAGLADAEQRARGKGI